MSPPQSPTPLPRKVGFGAYFSPSHHFRKRPNGDDQRQSYYDHALSDIANKLDSMSETVHTIRTDIAIIKTDVGHIRESFATEAFVLKVKSDVVSEIHSTSKEVTTLVAESKLSRWLLALFITASVAVIAAVIGAVITSLM